MTQAAKGQTVRIHYTGRLNDGTVFDSSRERDPLEFTLGSGQVIPGFDTAVTGMALNESKTITIPTGDAYGPHREELVVTMPRNELAANIEYSAGQRLRIQTPNGDLIVVVAAIDDTNITLDGNHPLAGQDLTFDLELVEIIAAP